MSATVQFAESTQVSGGCALIVGGSRGIGSACAFALADKGYDVVIAARTGFEVAETCRRLSLRCKNQKFRGEVIDARKDGDVEKLISRCLSFSGRLDVLVNSQGCALLGGLRDTTPKQFEQLLETNLTSVYRCVYYARGALAKSSGTVVNIISRSARQPYANAIAYGGTKSALVYLTRALAKDLDGDGVKVFGVCPGAVSTQMRREIFPDEDLTRLLQPEQIGYLVSQLTCPEYRVATGTILDIPW